MGFAPPHGARPTAWNSLRGGTRVGCPELGEPRPQAPAALTGTPRREGWPLTGDAAGVGIQAVIQRELEAMIGAEGWLENLLYVLLAVSVGLGLAAGLATRLSVGSRLEGVWQYAFLGSMAVVGAVTVGVLIFAPELWLAPAVGLTLMILLATCDFGTSQRAEAW